MKLAQENGNIVFFDAKGIPIAVPADSPSIQATRDPRDGTWHYTISASVAEGLALDSGGGALSGVGSALRSLFKPSVADVALGAKGVEIPSLANKLLGLGSTGSTGPANLSEQLAIEQAISNPAAGRQLLVPMTDSRWPSADGWVKSAQNINGIEILYVRNSITGAIDDFKFK